MENNWADFFHILNPNAFHGSKVAQFFKQSSWKNIRIERISHPAHLETVVTWAVREKVKKIAIWGGDGTLNRVVNAIFELNAFDQIELALFPAGTCNDFARKMDIPSWDNLVNCKAVSHPKRVDVGLMRHSEGRFAFINNAGFGRRMNATRGKRPHPVFDILSLRDHPVSIASNQAAGPPSKLMALLGIIFNAPYFGGGMHFSKDISPEDGVLNGYFLESQPRWRVLWSFIRGKQGHAFKNAHVYPLAGSSIKVSSAVGMYPQIDGEPGSTQAVTELEFSVLKNRLSFIIPQSQR